MNRIQKAAAAAMSLTITLIGSVSVTAPLALAGIHPLVRHDATSVQCTQVKSTVSTTNFRHG